MSYSHNKSASKSWKNERKIATLPGVEITPQVVLARSLDKARRMKATIVIIQWDDGTWDEDHSIMTLSDLCFLKEMFNLAVVDEIRNP